MDKGLEITAICIDHSTTDTPRVQQKIFVPFDFILDKVVSQFTDNNFEPVDYRVETTKAIPLDAEVKPACEIEGRIKEAEYWRDIIFSPEEQERKQTISLTDFILRIEELKASKSV